MAYDYDDNPVHCATCGSEIEPGARFCANCGAAAQTQPSFTPGYAPGMGYDGGPDYGAPVHVPNHLVWAIAATICCCLPTGIVAIVYAAQVNGKLAAGDYDGALSASNSAKTWCWVSLGLGIASLVVWGIVGLTGAI